jgi:serine/threonine protein kinase
MGEVYRARDTTLRREVAIKLVNPSVCGDPDSLSRLRREARALAVLNHPHVASVHELAEFDGFCGLVMELVPGPTLAEAVASRPLPVADALRLGAQVAGALEAAHERGLIHRDLKPANIKLTAEGAAKVLDFGLVTTEPDAHASAPPTMTTVRTETGVVIGTVCYMSPEQARGAAVDRRTDIWSFGCVLFEMITGARAFEGPSSTDTLVMIIEREPDWSLLPANTPPSVERLLRRCLKKDPRARLRDAGDARLELEEAATVGLPPSCSPASASAR